jgi:hypothetical protein
MDAAANMEDSSSANETTMLLSAPSSAWPSNEAVPSMWSFMTFLEASQAL